MKISQELVCECGNDKSQWADVCDSCRTIEQSKETKQIIAFVLIFSISLSLVVATIIEFEKQLANFFNRLEQNYLNAFHALPDFLQTFLVVFGSLLLVLMFIGMLAMMIVMSSRR